MKNLILITSLILNFFTILRVGLCLRDHELIDLSAKGGLIPCGDGEDGKVAYMDENGIVLIIEKCDGVGGYGGKGGKGGTGWK